MSPAERARNQTPRDILLTREYSVSNPIGEDQTGKPIRNPFVRCLNGTCRDSCPIC